MTRPCPASWFSTPTAASGSASTSPSPSFVNTIEDYPYPYVIGGTCWEFPCIVPSDWEGQNLNKANNPRTLADMKAALDAVVIKQGCVQPGLPSARLDSATTRSSS